MKVKKYSYQDMDKPGWKFSEVELTNMNLLVGDTATGKTRFMNTFFNLGLFIAQNQFKIGQWRVTFEHQNKTYTIELKSAPGDISDKSGKIINDNLWEHKENILEPIIERDVKKFLFYGNKMPPLSSKESSIHLLKEDPRIKPIFEAFNLYQRRTFDINWLEPFSGLGSIMPQHILDKSITETQALDQIFPHQTFLNVTLYSLKKYAYRIYKELINTYKDFFPFVRSTRITDSSKLLNIKLSGKVPVFWIQETGSDEWIPQQELSSGMFKVLLILTDLYLIPAGSVYLIDEYENSLGISAIDFFPEFITTFEKDIQFLITSHHPYLINKIPVKNWYVFHRQGLDVQIKYGQELQEKYSKSKQQAFLQLINDPFYKRES